MRKQPSQHDGERLRQALQKATSTAHVMVPDWKKPENEQSQRLRRAAIPKPTGRKLNDTNNRGAKKAANTSPAKTTAATLLKSGIGKATTEAFGVPPIKLV